MDKLNYCQSASAVILYPSMDKKITTSGEMFADIGSYHSCLLITIFLIEYIKLHVTPQNHVSFTQCIDKLIINDKRRVPEKQSDGKQLCRR